MQIKTADDVRQHIERVKFVAILRGDFSGKWPDLGSALVEGGIEAIEVTFSCPDAPGGIRALIKHCGAQAAIGAGTVLTTEQVDQVVAAGAGYVVAPNTNPGVVARIREHGVLAIPGAFTPTEIEYAYRLGAGMVKLFPAMPPGPAYLKDIRGPYPDIPIIVTGGVNLENMVAFLDAGANAVGMVGSLVGPDALAPGGLDRLRERARRVVSLIDEWRKRNAA
jgi:2-dehydro-3-deoxyphosphogluconate aldolase/(4S)-4-hydroxy-2-oxoglutarate aldolase